MFYLFTLKVNPFTCHTDLFTRGFGNSGQIILQIRIEFLHFDDEHIAASIFNTSFLYGSVEVTPKIRRGFGNESHENS